ncbi:hypothetical protein EVAR_83153_1 [Eumeta japonica]|uniref:Uncharacterized protein n=1 Tax=Eumeta variegata TaxID=151549 RepID=A0A4C1YBB5_EUMVA|nr:hypothetical protein EVAR_83153_1 [Eumeta japonica]
MDAEVFACVWLLYRRYKRRRQRQREYWVHPILRDRLAHGICLATGCSFADLHYGYRLRKSTITKFVEQVCKVLWTKLKLISMPEMTTEKWQEVEVEEVYWLYLGDKAVKSIERKVIAVVLLIRDSKMKSIPCVCRVRQCRCACYDLAEVTSGIAKDEE